MKWKNKLCEFDHEAEIYRGQDFFHKDIYIFGAGEIGKIFSCAVNRFCVLKAFIDNDVEKQGKVYCNFPVISLQKYLENKHDNALVVLCLKEEYCQTVKEQLLKHAFIEYEMFMTKDEYEKRLRIELFYKKNILYLPTVQISLTERCTLRCRKCAHACNFVPPDRKDLSMTKAKESADLLFKYVDYVIEFVLIGGEPLLYPYLPEIVDYIGSRYREKMDIFSITTNGTIKPKEDLLSICRKYDVLFRVSNYAESLPRLEDQMEAFKEITQSYGVSCIIGKKGKNWTDYGFDYVNRQGTPTQLEKVFDACKTQCHEIRGSKFYFCVMARSVAENMKRNVGDEDFFDLASGTTDARKKEFFEYTMGCSNKGYLDMCNYCHGAERIYYPIPAGEQMR